DLWSESRVDGYTAHSGSGTQEFFPGVETWGCLAQRGAGTIGSTWATRIPARWLRLGCVRPFILPRSATAIPQLCEASDGPLNRSKFNVPLGVASQGFCVLPHGPGPSSA